MRSPDRTKWLLTATLLTLGACGVGDAAQSATSPHATTSSTPATAMTSTPQHDLTASRANRPPIDRDAPSAFETATFALG